MVAPRREVDADLRMTEVGVGELRVVGRGARLALLVPSLGAALRLARRLGGRGGWLVALDTALKRSGLGLEVVSGPWEVARLGNAAAPTALARWLGLWPAEVRPGRLVRAILHAEPRP